MENKCTVLVNSCDAYEDLWYPFFKMFRECWENCPYEIILNTESKIYKDEKMNVKTFHFYGSEEKIPYGKRIRRCLEEVKTPYTLLMLDDFFLREEVDQEKLEEVMSYMDEAPDVTCFNFDVQNDKYDIDDGRFPGFCKRSLYGAYRYNMQAGIWRTKELYNAWKDKESPWQWELYGNVRSWKKSKKIYIKKREMKTPLEYGYYPDIWGVYRGKWVIQDVKKLFEDHDIKVDFSARGIYEKRQETSDCSRKIFQKLYSFGINRFIKYCFWHFKEVVALKLNKNRCRYSYSEYLNRKEYEVLK